MWKLIKNHLLKIEFKKLVDFINAIFVVFMLAGGSFVEAQTPKSNAAQPSPTPSAQQRREYEEKAKFATDRLRPNNSGQMLNWADAADRREIIRRFEDGAKLWHQAGRHVEEFETLGEVVAGYAYLNEFQPALEAAIIGLTAVRETGNRSIEFAALSGISEIYKKTNEPHRAVESLNKALTLLQSDAMRHDWSPKYGLGPHTDAMLERQKHLKISRTEKINRQTEADIRALQTRTLMSIADIHKASGEPARAAVIYAQALAAAHPTTTGLTNFGYGEIFKIIRTVAQSYLDLKQPNRAVELIEEEIKRAAENEYLETDLRGLLEQVKTGSTKFLEQK